MKHLAYHAIILPRILAFLLYTYSDKVSGLKPLTLSDVL